MSELVGFISCNANSIFVAVLIALIMFGARKTSQIIAQARANNEAIKEGMRALIKQNLVMVHTFVCRHHGTLDDRISQQLIDGYKAYKELGGNGVGDKMVHEIETMTGLPIQAEIEKMRKD